HSHRFLPGAPVRAAPRCRHSVPVRARRAWALRRRADSADPPNAGDPALRWLARPIVQGSAIESLRAFVCNLADPHRSDVPATEGAGVAHVDSDLRAVRVAVARVAWRSVACGRARAIV